MSWPRWLVCCRHDREAHRHYRPGSDCSLCDCPQWRRWGRNG